MYIFIDYDGTIVKSSEEEFMKAYFKNLSNYFGIPFNEILSLVMDSVNEAMKSTDGTKSLYLKFADVFSKKTDKPFGILGREIHLFLRKHIRSSQRCHRAKPQTHWFDQVYQSKVSFYIQSALPRDCVTVKRIKFAGLSPDNSSTLHTWRIVDLQSQIPCSSKI